MRVIYTMPGIGGSGDGHWQTLWERADPAIRRIEQADWDRPDLDRWRDRALAVLDTGGGGALLVAHSLGCLLVPEIDRAGRPAIAGAMLVAVPDPTSPAFPEQADSFRRARAERLSFPTLLVASADDPYGSVSHAHAQAARWGGRVVEIGARGHVNADSGLGDWPEGRRLFDAFRAGLRL